MQEVLLAALARHGRLRRTFLDPDLAVPNRHHPLPQRAALVPPPPARRRAARSPPAATHQARRGHLARALPRCPPRRAPRRGPGARGEVRGARGDIAGVHHRGRSAPPRQRAALILRDVLGFPASEAARILEVTEESLTSALKRARANLRDGVPARPRSRPADRAAEKDLAERLTAAYQAGDVAAIIALFNDDAWLTMPPFPLEYQGRELIGSFLAAVAFRDGRTYRLIETRANGQLAFGAFLTEPRPADQDANGLIVLAVTSGQIAAMTRFPANVLPRFAWAGYARKIAVEQRTGGRAGRRAARRYGQLRRRQQYEAKPKRQPPSLHWPGRQALAGASAQCAR